MALWTIFRWTVFCHGRSNIILFNVMFSEELEVGVVDVVVVAITLKR